ncbi:MAG: hypothetical protein SPK50_08920 [Mobiluncus porci]|uniref:Addiction module toxin RelE n=1 Tax=Mobiluncus porci TaxID=2652278 RepID=A0A7K0K1V0_9ACTO|nr:MULTISPECIES: hypothetical protein [Mobiluncus]MCI6584872.1 hypothetical protein [Mobiluncus sp.]MDD7541663.1 hypothetical protein [Mobiluncus porci]MDY5749234.1 hypothetical protein [Mobiluncus porci]MST49453.1 hypothetical protein [Mobiluncus porci]
MWIFQFHETGCKAVFKKFAPQQALLEDAITHALNAQLETDFVKTKLASRRTFEGLKVYECRVNTGKLPALRVAFTVRDRTVTVVYLSNHIQKSDFTHEIEAFLK